MVPEISENLKNWLGLNSLKDWLGLFTWAAAWSVRRLH